MTDQPKSTGALLENDLRKAEERLAGILDIASDGIISIDASQCIIVFNRGAERIFGYRSEEVLGKPLDLLLPVRCAQDHFQQVQSFAAAPEKYRIMGARREVAGRRKDGSEFPAEVGISKSSVGGTVSMTAVVRDITDQRLVLEALQESTQRLQQEVIDRQRRLALQSATALVFAEANSLEEVAPRVLRAIGETLAYDEGAMWTVDQQARVLRCAEIWSVPKPALGVFSAASRQMTFAPGVGLPGRVWSSGKPVWILDVTTDSNFPRVAAAIQADLHSAVGFPIIVGGKTVGVIEFFSQRCDEPDEYLLAMMATVGNQIGQFIERKSLEEQFRHSQKMEAFGQLAGGVAHDFNNLLTIISGYSEMMLQRLPAHDPGRDLVQEIYRAGERAASLTRQLLAFSRKQVLAPKVLDLNAVIADTEKMLRRLIGEDVALVMVLAPDLEPVKVDPGQIEQVIMNLAVNARDAMSEGGKLTIETRNVDLDETYATAYPDVKPGRYVMLAVSDTGSGMTPDVQARIFEPFFTTKGPGKGTGLGLATVFGIVKQSGAHINVYSEPGHGAVFKIYLPIVKEKISSGRSLHDLRVAALGNETILLVEDDDAVRSLGRFCLQTLGYRVLEASNGQEAILIHEQHQGPIHLLITDVVMPEMGGRQLAEQLATRTAGMKVLYVSGYTDDAVFRHGVLEAEVAFLQKPFTIAALANKVREVLDS